MKEPNVEPESDPPADTPTPAVETALVTISQHPEALVEFFEPHPGRGASGRMRGLTPSQSPTSNQNGTIWPLRPGTKS